MEVVEIEVGSWDRTSACSALTSAVDGIHPEIICNDFGEIVMVIYMYIYMCVCMYVFMFCNLLLSLIITIMISMHYHYQD